VAGHAVPFGVGLDTTGEVRVPAALCGCVGFRPSHGRYNTSGLLTVSQTLDAPGIVARTVEDVQLIDAVVAAGAPASVVPKAPSAAAVASLPSPKAAEATPAPAASSSSDAASASGGTPNPALGVTMTPAQLAAQAAAEAEKEKAAAEAAAKEAAKARFKDDDE
jgi:Asp-tRNA(Asn)/Glu-tRNA(Gln) amidotransferase A subunit family amidase